MDDVPPVEPARHQLVLEVLQDDGFHVQAEVVDLALEV